jgi:hypothetical protein
MNAFISASTSGDEPKGYFYGVWHIAESAFTALIALWYSKNEKFWLCNWIRLSSYRRNAFEKS